MRGLEPHDLAHPRLSDELAAWIQASQGLPDAQTAKTNGHTRAGTSMASTPTDEQFDRYKQEVGVSD